MFIYRVYLPNALTIAHQSDPEFINVMDFTSHTAARKWLKSRLDMPARVADWFIASTYVGGN